MFCISIKVNKKCPIFVKILGSEYCLYPNNCLSLWSFFMKGLIISHYPNMIFHVLNFTMFYKLFHFTKTPFCLILLLYWLKLCGNKNCNFNLKKFKARTWSLLLGQTYTKKNCRARVQFVLYRNFLSIKKEKRQ